MCVDIVPAPVPAFFAGTIRRGRMAWGFESARLLRGLIYPEALSTPRPLMNSMRPFIFSYGVSCLPFRKFSQLHAQKIVRAVWKFSPTKVYKSIIWHTFVALMHIFAYSCIRKHRKRNFCIPLGGIMRLYANVCL